MSRKFDWRSLFAFKMRSELKELYQFSALFWLAQALIAIFEPVFFYKQAFPLWLIMAYYGLHYGSYMLVLPLGAKFASRFGLERSIAVAMPIFAVYFLLLATIPTVPALFWVTWILLTSFKIFFWPAFMAAQARFGDRTNRGSEQSLLQVLQMGVGVLGPMFGGLIAAYFGFPVLFIIVAGIIALSMVPILRTKERVVVRDFEYDSPWKVIRSRAHRRMVRATIGWGEDFVMGMVWPIFAFIVLGGADRLGFVFSSSVLVVVPFIFFLGEANDRFGRRLIIRMSVPFYVLSHLYRPFAGTPSLIWLTRALGVASGMGTKVPFWSRLFAEGKRVGSLRYVTAFEMWLALIKSLTAFGLAIAFATLLPYQAFSTAFAVAAIFSAFYLFL